MQLRTLHLDDLDDALALWERTEHLGRVPRAEVERVVDHDADLVLVAEEDGQLLGLVLGTYDGRRGWIQRLAVDPAVRRRGVARALVEELERRLWARGCEQINLLVFEANDAGRRFWEDIGYAGNENIVMYHRRVDGGGDARGGGGAHASHRPDC